MLPCDILSILKNARKGVSGLAQYVNADDVRRLIETVLSDEKLKKSGNFSDKVYTDEPIIATAGQLSGYVPTEIIEMRKLADSYNMTEAEIFYRQAQFMADYTDECHYHGDFVRYFPTYRSMNTAQLRGYFTWRTKVRLGICEPAPLSFAFLYIYELLMLIGVKSPEEGYAELERFGGAYAELFPQIGRYLKRWKNDFVVYYGLDNSLFEGAEYDEALWTLLNFRERSESEMFRAVLTFSAYPLERSKFFEEYPEDMAKVICRVLGKISDHYEKNRKKDLFTRLFGAKTTCIYIMFGSAVFYDIKKYKDYKYKVNEIHSYTCKKGSWSCEMYYGGCSKSHELGDIVKTIESCLRDEFGFRALKPALSAKYILSIIKKEIALYLEEKKKNEKPVISLDLSKLGDIRRSADITRDRLIVEEETEPETDEIRREEKAPEKQLPAADETELCDMLGLSAAEYAFLRALLYGQPYSDILRANATTALLLSDGVNEKLFDLFGDTVIEFSGDEPILIDDYTDELKERIPQ